MVPHSPPHYPTPLIVSSPTHISTNDEEEPSEEEILTLPIMPTIEHVEAEEPIPTTTLPPHSH